MGKTLYLECYSGISGDMTVAALLDLGADAEVLNQALKSLPVQGFDIKVSRVKKSGIDACDFDVILDHDNHDHDMEYLHGHDHHEHNHHEYHDHEHHEHAHEHDHHAHDHHAHDHHEHSHHGYDHHDHEHRGMKEITEIISRAKLTDRARETALRIFGILAEAESKAHNVPVDEVHFHEVGAVDSIVDIVSVAVCLDNLDITEVIVPQLCEGTGTVRCQHGILPIPVPAVANIISAHQLPIRITDVKGELVTPTGAAIVAALRTGETLPASCKFEKIGIGAGKRQYECPGILRAILLKTGNQEEQIVKLETNIDDSTGEALGYVLERLFDAGARDAHFSPVFMKKNRPGWLLTVICTEDKIDILQNIIFSETTSIGIRRVTMDRTALKREFKEVETPIGTIRLKVCFVNGEERCYPEYESIRKICLETGRSYQDVTQIVAAHCK